MRSFLATFLLIAACQGGTGTPVASASPVAAVATPAATPVATPGLPSGSVSIAGRKIPVDIADTPETRRQGLSGRPSLATDTGLVLAWDYPTVVSIWMPDMNFPIDVIFVRDGRVLKIYKDEPPCVPGDPCPTFGPTLPVDFVLEVPAGSAEGWGLKLDSPASFQKN